jgi:hypothetical protein
LVGKAASLCVQSNSQELVFTNFVLELSNVKTLSEINPTLNEIEIIAKHVKGKLFGHFVKIMSIQINDVANSGGNLRTFMRVKKDFQFEIFLNTVSIQKHRQAVTKLRISAHKLPGECGRCKNIP